MSAIIAETEVTISERCEERYDSSSETAPRYGFWRTLFWLIGLKRAP